MKLVLSSSLAGPGHAKFHLRSGISTTCRLMLAASVLLLTSNMLRAETTYAMATAANTSRVIGISGSVKNENGEALEMANVMVKGTSTGAITDHAGRFTLNAPNTQATLVVSLMGYQTQEIPLNGRAVVDVVLIENSKALNEVVVIGYGIQKKADLSSSIATVNPKDLLKVPGGFQAAMQSQVPGVQITGDKIRISRFANGS